MGINQFAYFASLGINLRYETLFVLFYLGPESIMPLASILAAILGFILIFWRFIFKWIKKVFSPIINRFRKSPSVEPEPELSQDDTSSDL